MNISELFHEKQAVWGLRLTYNDCWLFVNDDGTFNVFQQKYRKPTRKIADHVTEEEAVAILIEHAEA